MNEQRLDTFLNAVAAGFGLLAVVARLDGKCFSNLTRGLNRPFDDSFSMYMQLVTKRLVLMFVAFICWLISLKDHVNDLESMLHRYRGDFHDLQGKVSALKANTKEPS